jgi:hypothetical protein
MRYVIAALSNLVPNKIKLRLISSPGQHSSAVNAVDKIQNRYPEELLPVMLPLREEF